MIKILTEYLEGEITVGALPFKCLAVTILDMCEDAGMSPPEFDNYSPDNASRIFSSDSDWGKGNDDRYYLKQKIWEPENE